MATAQPRPLQSGPCLTLSDMPAEVIERIIARLPLRDLTSVNAVSRLFRCGTPDGSRSVVEVVLRSRAAQRSWAGSLPSAPGADTRTWTGELFMRERVSRLAATHTALVACSQLANVMMSALVDEGKLYTCGEEHVHDHGHPTGEYTFLAALGTRPGPSHGVLTQVCSLSAVRVCAVAAGWRHLLALSDVGAVYACGENAFGQLGVGDTGTRVSFQRVAAMASEAVVCIAAASSRSLALTAAGRAYSWGENGFGHLGHGDHETRLEPTRIAALDGVRAGAIAAAHTHTLVLSVSGAVFSYGGGSSGQLGHGDSLDQPTPTRIGALAHVQVVHVSAGRSHSLVVDAAGHVHACGATAPGCLGLGDVQHLPMLILEPARIDALLNVRAVRAVAGSITSAVLSENGTVYTFGLNDRGQLGLGSELAYRRVPVPTRVAEFADERVVDCAFGSSHTLFKTDAYGEYDSFTFSCGSPSAALGQNYHLAELEAEGDELPPDLVTPTRISVFFVHGGTSSI